MPKVGMQPIRKAALIDAAIAEIGKAGTLDVTVGQIARRAGVSSGLAHHYFGSKEQIFLASMRHIMTSFGQRVRLGLKDTNTPRKRLDAIIAACFDEDEFTPEVISSWLVFYVQAQTSPEAELLLNVYSRRLHSNLVFNLRQLVSTDDAHKIAAGLAALIDGFYIRQALKKSKLGRKDTIALVRGYIDLNLSKQEAS